MKNKLNIAITLILIILSIIISSCQKNNISYIKDFQDLFNTQNNKKTIVIVGAQPIENYLNLFSINRLKRKYDDYDFAFCDITSRKNVHLKYILHTNKLPIVIVTSKEGTIEFYSTEIKDYADIKKLLKNIDNPPVNDLTSSYYSETGTSLLNLINNLTSAYKYIYINKDTTHAISLLSIIPSQNSYFYPNYLEYILKSKSNSLIHHKETVLNRLISECENDPIYEYINIKLQKEVSSSEFPIIVAEFKIDVGEIKHSDSAIVNIPCYNTGNSALIILEAIPSCNCIQVEYPKVIKPNDIGNIKIKYQANKNDPLGEFMRSITLITNTKHSNETFTITGQLIK